MSMDTSAPTEPVRKSVRVECDVERAFWVFVEDFGSWWPADVHSRAAHDEYGDGVTAEHVVFEQRVGGRLYEVTSEGVDGSWAEVVVFEPPHRLVLAWKPNDRDEPATEVEIRFEADGDGTVVRLEHRGWDRLGERAVEARNGYDQGWSVPLERFVAAAAG